MELRLGHGALEAQEQPIVEVGRIIDAVFVQDERIGERADLQEPMPVRRIARQARHLEAHDDPGPTHADFGDQSLEARPIDGRRAGQSLIIVDHDDLIMCPPERDRALLQGVLALRTLGVLEDLPER